LTREEAYRLPLGVLWSEAHLVQRRVRQAHATDAILFHAAAVDVLSTNSNHFKATLERLTNG
jgi:hypothetical protein